jgi:hypothetical protein
MAFKQIRVSPILDLDAYADNDVLFPLTEIQLPTNGTCKITAITLINRAEIAPSGYDVNLLFLNDNSQELGTVNATAGTLTYNNARQSVTANAIISTRQSSAVNDFDNFTIASSVSHAGATNFGITPILVEPKSGSRSVWFSAISNGVTPTYAGATGVLANGAVSTGASTTITVDTVDATLHFKVGDTVVDADDNVFGVIESLTATSITFTAVTGEDLANNEELFTPHQLEFIFDIEY